VSIPLLGERAIESDNVKVWIGLFTVLHLVCGDWPEFADC
jgi:hypothetical protein